MIGCGNSSKLRVSFPYFPLTSLIISFVIPFINEDEKHGSRGLRLIYRISLKYSLHLFLLILVAFVPPFPGGGNESSEIVEIEYATFQGGFGIDFFEDSCRQYEKLHPNVKIKFWGNPRVWEQLLPRFAAGTPPDLCWPGWGMNIWKLVFDHHLEPLNKYLGEPACNSDKKWQDTFIPTLLDKGKYKDNYYFIPFNFNAFGIWYNKKLFEENGWEIPKTYEELQVLCDKIKEKRIAPLTFTGRYPSYAWRGFLYPWIISAGGYDLFKRIGNLEEGAWKDPACLRAATSLLEMKKKQFFQAGCIGMNHTESQMEFLVGRAAMIPCGTWLHSEMKNILPPDFEMEFFIPPVFSDGIGDPTIVSAGVDCQWIISAKSKHKNAAADFLKFISSPEKAKDFILKKGSMMAVKIEGDFDPPKHLINSLRAVKEASFIYSPEFESWYPSLSSEINSSFSRFYNEQITAEQFLEKLEQASRMVREDKLIPKFIME
jgi:N-acetylglucosamine transport system substrate-binding protein